jgi:hypothetical protein
MEVCCNGRSSTEEVLPALPTLVNIGWTTQACDAAPAPVNAQAVTKLPEWNETCRNHAMDQVARME